MSNCPASKILRLFFKVAVIMIFVANIAAVAAILVPQTKTPPLLDGLCPDADWKPAIRNELGQGVQMLAMQTKDAVHLCLVLPPGSFGSYDLYLEDREGQLWNLHSSAQVGERKLMGGTWGDFVWGNHQGWYSPPVAFTGFKTNDQGQRTAAFAAAQSREIEIRKDRFDLGRSWKMMINLRALGPSRNGTVNYPSDAHPDHPDAWATMILPN